MFVGGRCFGGRAGVRADVSLEDLGCGLDESWGHLEGLHRRSLEIFGVSS